MTRRVPPIEHFSDFCLSLRQTDDRWAGEPLELESWQKRMMREALAEDTDGLPKWKTIVILVPRKNGKSVLLAAVALYELVYGVGRPEILLAASSDKQAGRLFDACARFVYQSAALAKIVRVRDNEGSAKPMPGFANTDTVFGGGEFTFAGVVRSFSVSATNGSGTLVYGVGQLVAQITCVNISGNTAVVGGTIVSAANASYVGDPMDTYFVDNGPPSGSSVGGDQVSPIEIGAPGTFGGLPKTCPATDASQAVDSLDAGDIVVHAKGS